MKSKSSYWVKTLQNGVIGGGISLLLGLVGMVLAFGTTYVISGVITMGQIFILAPFLFEALHVSAKSAVKKNRVPFINRRVERPGGRRGAGAICPDRGGCQSTGSVG